MLRWVAIICDEMQHKRQTLKKVTHNRKNITQRKTALTCITKKTNKLRSRSIQLTNNSREGNVLGGGYISKNNN